MMLLYTGTPGSGKSLDTARVILGQVARKQPVIANFNVKLPKRLEKNKDCFTYKPDDFLTPEYLYYFASEYFKTHKFKEGKILLIIDEAQIMFNSREWSKSGRSDWLKFFTNHRHYGFDIILACQFDLMIDKQIRSLVEYEVIHRKMSNYGLKGWFFQLLLLSPCLFCRVKVWYPMKEKIDFSFYRYTPRWAKIYDSYDSVFAEGIENAPKHETLQTN